MRDLMEIVACPGLSVAVRHGPGHVVVVVRGDLDLATVLVAQAAPAGYDLAVCAPDRLPE